MPDQLSPSHPAHFIWLVPTEGFPDSEALSAFTKRLQEQTKTPRFMPHVTLYKALPSEVAQGALVDALTSALIHWRSLRQSSPLRLSFTDTGATDKYFQSLFAVIQKDVEPLKSLWHALDGTLRGYFNGNAQWQDYLPHLSFIYATEEQITPAQKVDIISELEKDGSIEKGDASMLIHGVRDLPAKALDVMLVRSNGPVSSWEVLHRTPLLP